jgi:hypothetical protein
VIESTGWQRSGRRLLALTQEGHVSPRMRTSRAGFKRRIAGGLLAALLSVGALLSSLAIATPASADTDFCGRRISDINPGTNGIAALQELTAQGENQVIHNILSGAGLGPEWCGPAQFAMDVGADMIVGGAEMRLFDVETPGASDFLIAVYDTAASRHQQSQPSVLPDVGPSGVAGVWAAAAWTGTDGLNIRPEPDTALPSVGHVADGTALHIECTTYGQTIAGGGGTTSLWDRVTYNGVTGYVTDSRINTGTNQPVAPSC